MKNKNIGNKILSGVFILPAVVFGSLTVYCLIMDLVGAGGPDATWNCGVLLYGLIFLASLLFAAPFGLVILIFGCPSNWKSASEVITQADAEPSNASVR